MIDAQQEMSADQHHGVAQRQSARAEWAVDAQLFLQAVVEVAMRRLEGERSAAAGDVPVTTPSTTSRPLRGRRTARSRSQRSTQPA